MLAVGVPVDVDIFDSLLEQGAPQDVIEQARDLIGGIPEHGLVVRVGNEGKSSVLLTGFGEVAPQEW